MRTIYLHGRMGKIFGKVWRLDVRSPQEAIHALQQQTKKLYDYFRKSTERNIGYKIVIGERGVSDTVELLHEFDESVDFHFYPVPCGRQSQQQSGGMWQTIIGVVLIIIGIILWAYGGAGLAKLGVALIAAGVATTLEGVATLMMKVPKPQLQSDQGSYIFGGQVNVMRQGGPIPIGYGEMIIGSQVISLSVRNDRIWATPPNDSTTTTTNHQGGNTTTAVLFGAEFD